MFFNEPLKKNVIVFETKPPYEIALIEVNKRSNHFDLIRMAIRCFYNIDGNDFERIHSEYPREALEYGTNFMTINDKES
jgi:hypothetical protein